MVVKESDQLIATQIAYANLDEALARLKLEGKDLTLKNLIEDANNHKDYLNGLNNYLDSNGTFKKGYEHVADWQIIDCKNDNYDGAEYSGFYGCIIDTGDARILACRGSEGIGSIKKLNFKNLIQDWIKADFGLINSIETDQEKVLREYMRENADLLSEKPWVATGHSLGGTLADHAAIVSAEERIGNFSGAINFDGPGHSQEYIKKHREAIEKVSSKMIHKKASVVGNLLFDIPGAIQEYIETSNESRYLDKNGNPISTIDGFVANFLEHDTQYWVLDENGNTVSGKQSSLEYIMEKLSRGVDRLPAPISNMLPKILLLVAEGLAWVSDLREKNPDFDNMVITAAVSFILLNPGGTMIAVNTIATLAVIIALTAIITIAKEIIIESLEQITAEVSKKICETISWLSGKAISLFEAMTNVINDMRQWFREKNNSGATYIQGNPYFKADTDKLREYAARLERVNNRLSKLDSNMRSLYWQVGLLDLWDILLANMITSKSYAINQAKKYLYNTADRFENAENKAKNYIGG